MKNCSKPKPNSGLIIKAFAEPCYPIVKVENLIIRTDSALKRTFISEDPYYNDVPCELPEVDFEKFSIIGHRTDGGGCDMRVGRHVEFDVDSKTIYYELDILNCGNSSMSITYFNFVLVPKVSDEWTLHAKVTEERGL